MSVDTELLDRITKLLRLASDKGATEAEAATALAKAHEILASHNLTMDQVDQRDRAKKADGQVGRQMTTINKWDTELFTWMAEANYCKVLRARRFTMYVIGRPTNVQVFLTMFAWVKEQRERFWNEEWLNDPRHGYMNWRTHKAGFCKGFAIRIYRRLKTDQATEATEVQSMALVRVDENQQFIDTAFTKVRTGAKNDRKFDAVAMATGYARGADATMVKRGELTGA